MNVCNPETPYKRIRLTMFINIVNSLTPGSRENSLPLLSALRNPAERAFTGRTMCFQELRMICFTRNRSSRGLL